MTTEEAELLWLAAKAAKLNFGVIHGLPRIRCDAGWTPWNPIDDDRDALRLALTLGLSLEPYPLYSTEKHSVIVKRRRRSDQLRESNPTECIECYRGDPMGATRRAITRAAAACAPADPV